MSRLSIRPRPLDIHKRLPIVKNLKDFDDEDIPATSSTRMHMLRLAAEADTEVQVQHQIPSRRVASEIPTPEFVVVDTYERDYSRTFNQPNSYLRARGARAEIGDFVEYDLDNEDEDWLQEFNRDRMTLTAEKLEAIIFKLEALDHKARERAGVITPTLVSPIPVLLTFDAAVEALQALSISFGVFRSVYNFWKEKRERWKKPVLRRLQPPPPVNDTNPFNVFRPREKAHRLHTRRISYSGTRGMNYYMGNASKLMQRRENNVQSFEKLRQVRRNLDQAKILLEAVIKREEKKREVMESEVSLQRIQLKYKHEPELIEDSLALPSFPSVPGNYVSSDDEFVDSDDVSNSRPQTRPFVPHSNPFFMDSKLVTASGGSMNRKFRRRHVPDTWLNKLDPLEPVMLFTKPLEPEKLAAAGIVPPPDSSISSGEASSQRFNVRGRIGRGGRIIFDRWNPLTHNPMDCGDSLYTTPPKSRPSTLV